MKKLLFFLLLTIGGGLFAQNVNPYTCPTSSSGTNTVLRAGNYTNIVIFVSFPNAPNFDIMPPAEEVDYLFNGEEPGSSLFSYFRDISDGRFNIKSKFYPKPGDPPCIAPLSRSYYEVKDLSPTTPDLKVFAKNFVEIQVLNDFPDYHTGNYVTTYIVQGDKFEWSYYLWPSGGGNETFIMEGSLDLGTLVHEMYHCLGAPDLYVHPPDGSGKITPVGIWDPMETATTHPQSSLAYITNKCGRFIDESQIHEITQPGRYTLYDSWNRTPGDTVAYKITSPASNDGEFFVLEYRRNHASGGRIYESNNNEGIIISRINPTVNGNAGSDGTSANPFGVYVYRDSGTYTINGNLGNACFKLGGLALFDDSSNPSAFLSNGNPGLKGIVIDNFSAAGGASMTFDVTFPQAGPWCIGKINREDVQASLTTGGVLNIWRNGILGNGDMLDWGPDEDPQKPPWYDYRESIKNVIIDFGVTNIGDFAFDGIGFGGTTVNYTNLNSVTIPNSVAYIGSSSFSNCINLTSVTIPNSVVTIRQLAFEGCTNLANVNIDPLNNIKSIEKQAFYKCSRLQSFTIPAGISIINEFVFAQSGLTSINIPCNITAIDNNAFSGCKDLEKVWICKSVTTMIVDKGAGDASSIFNGCTGLTDVWVYWEYPLPILINTFYRVSPPVGEIRLHVPCLYYENYANSAHYADAKYWEDLDIVSDDPTIIVLANPPSDGTVTACGKTVPCGTTITVPCGEEVTITATPNTHYEFEKWTTVNNSLVSNNPVHKFIANNDSTLVAHFKLKSYTITLLSNPLGAAATLMGGGKHNYQSWINVSAMFDNECYTFINWTKNDGTEVSIVPNFTFEVEEDCTLTANFEPKPAIVVLLTDPENGDGGEAYGNDIPGGGIYNCGDELTLKVIPAHCYKFVEWRENGEHFSYNADTMITVTTTTPRILIAYFGWDDYNITGTPNLSEGGSVDGDGSYPCDSTATLEAISNECYRFVNWIDANDPAFSSDENPLTIYPVIKHRNLIANFELIICHITAMPEPPVYGFLSVEPYSGIFYFGDYAPCGEEITVTAIPYSCYEFEKWTVNGDEVSRNNPHIFTVTKLCEFDTLKAHFTLREFDIIIEIEPEGCEGRISGSGTYPCGDMVTVEAFSDDCCQFIKWMENGEDVPLPPGSNVYSFPVYENHTLTALFEPILYNVTVSADPPQGGTLTGGGSYVCGATINLVAEADTCYTFLYWMEGTDTVSKGADYTFILGANRNLVAHFKRDYYEVTASVCATGGGAVIGGENYYCGEQVTLVAEADTCYTFLFWTEGTDTVSTNLEYKFILGTSDRELVAHFNLDYYDVFVSTYPTEGGTVIGSGSYACGTTITLVAEADTCYTFMGWTENGIPILPVDLTHIFTIGTSNREFVAHFDLNYYNVTVSVDPPDGVEVFGTGNFYCGEMVTITAVADTCYSFLFWAEGADTVSTNLEYEFILGKSNREFIAHFELDYYDVTVSANAMGGGTATGSGNFYCGETVTVTATPDSCFSFSNWTENDTVVSTDAVYVFEITKDHSLVAHFEMKRLNIHLSANPIYGGEVFGIDDDIICGEERTITALPLLNCVFKSWTKIDSTFVSNEAEITFYVTDSILLVANFACETFNITVSANPPEGGTASGGGTDILYMSEITVSALPDDCYEFIGWIEEGDTVSTNLDYSFFVTEDRTLEALFEIKTLIVTATSNPPDGGILSMDTAHLTCNTEITMIATPNVGYRFINWTMNGDMVSEDSVFTFIVKDSMHLVANFEYVTYNITLQPYPFFYYGQLFESGEYPLNYELTVHAVANIEYVFVNWTEDSLEVSSDADYTFIVNRDRLLIGNFTTKTLDVELSASPGIGGNVEGGSTDIPYGEWITITATPNEYFVFVNWTENGEHISDSAEYSFPVHHSCHLVANFEPESCLIKLTPNPSGGGTLEGGGSFYIGTQRTVTAFPASDYTFEKWTENDSILSFNTDYTFTVMRSCSLVAHFTPKNYIINLSAYLPEGGEVYGGGSFLYQETATVWAEANPNYVFVNWTEEGDTVSTNAEYSFPVTRSRNLVANFVLETYNIDLSAEPSEGGWVQGAGYNIPWGTDTIVRAYPNTHYSFVNWTENEEPVSVDAFYGFVVKKSRNLVANFIPKNYNIEVYASPPEWGTVSGGGIFTYQENITVTAEAKTGYMFVSWTEEGDTVSTNAEYSFQILCNRILTANFVIAEYNIILDAEPPEGGTVVGSESNIPHGVQKTVTAIPNDFYNFAGWFEDNILVSPFAEFSFIVSKSRFLVAHFTKILIPITLISTPLNGGMLLGGGNIPHGSEVTISAEANDCYEFVAWIEEKDTITFEPQFTFTVIEPRTFVACFAMTKVSITTSANLPEGGTVSGEYIDILCGTPITVYAYPKPEYNFINWTLEGEELSTNPEFTFQATFSGELVANFVINYYTITLFADPPDIGEVEGGGVFPYGTEITVSAEPYEGFSFTQWMEGDKVVSTDADFTFIVKKSQTLIALFEKTMYTIIVEVNDSLCGYATGSGRYDIDEIVQVRAFEKDGYQFAHWTIDDVVVSTTNSYRFYATRNLTIVAKFFILDFDTYAATLWDNTFMLNLKKLDNEGYEIKDCRWFKNGIEVAETNTIDAFSYSAGSRKTDLLELAPTYYMFQLITKEGKLLNSTKKMLTEYKFELTSPQNRLVVYPNPVFSGISFTIEGVTAGSMIEVFNQMGVCVSRKMATEEAATLILQLPAGVYIIRNHNKEAKITVVK